MSTETFWRKRSTFGKGLSFWLFFILLFNVLPQVCQNGLLRVQKNNLGSFFWIYFGFMLGLRAKNYRTLEYKALPLSSKQHPIYWKGLIWEFLFFLDFLQFQKFLPTVGEVFVDFRPIFIDRVIKTLLHVSRVTFWGTLDFLRKKLILDSTLLSRTRTSATFFGNSLEVSRVFGQKRQGCQNCIAFVRRNFPRKSIGLKNLIVVS